MSQKIIQIANPDLNDKIDHVIQGIDEKVLELNSCTDSAYQFELVEDLKKLHKTLNRLRCKSTN